MLQASATATAPLAKALHSGPAGASSAGQGAVLAVPPDYLNHIKTFRILQGGLKPGGVVLDQQMAATLQARLGDTVSLVTAPGREARAVHGHRRGDRELRGPAVPAAQPVDRPGARPAAGQHRGHARRHVRHEARADGPGDHPGQRRVERAARRAGRRPVAGAGAARPGPLSSSTPSNAYARATQTTNRLERTLPGQVQFVDNLSDSLNTAAGDALYAQTLYIMLAVPGALIALGLAYLAALGTVERDRRDLSLLRARGATRRDLLTLAGIESAIVGVVAGLLGAGVALAAVQLLVAGGAQLTLGRSLLVVGVCVLLAIAGAAAARVGASVSALRGSVAEGRRTAQREKRPLWQRLYVDVVCLGVSGLIYWLTAKTGFSAVVNPDSNPTLSLSVYMFFAPALLWLGATLLLVRLRGRMLAWAARRAAGDRASTTARLPAGERRPAAGPRSTAA